VFDIGMFELLLILIVGLLVLGPERLPEVARLIGAFSAKIRRTLIDIRLSVEQEVNAHELQKRLDEQIKHHTEYNPFDSDPPETAEDHSQQTNKGEGKPLDPK